MEFNLSRLPYDAIHIFGEEDFGVVHMNWVTPVDTVVRHGRIVRMFLTDVSVVILQALVNRKA
jgi:hypothetical protein